MSINPRKNQDTFYKLQEQELRWLKVNKMINNTSYIYLALKIENPFCDRPIKIRVKEFALHWGIPESSIYECIAKLKELESISIQTKEIVISWRTFSQQDGLSGNPESFRDSRMDSEIPESVPETQNGFRDSRMDSEIPESPIYKDRARDQTYSDFNQTYSDSLYTSDEREKEKETKNIPVGVIEESSPEKDESSHIAVEEQKSSVAMAVKTKSSSEGNYSAGNCDNKELSPRLQKLLNDYYSDVITDIPVPEKQEIAKHLLGKELVCKYRNSGRILNRKPNDLNPDFVRFVAWYRWNSDDVTKAVDQICNTERSIEKWSHLQNWVEAWESHVTNPEKIEMESARRRGKKAPQNRVDQAIAHSQLDKMKQEAEQIYRNLGLPVAPANDYNYDF